MREKFSIAIDGPAGAGKSTIAKLLARKLGIVYIDTGAMYRAAALEAIRRGIDTTDEEKVGEMVEKIDISIKITPNEQAVLLGGENVEHLIRTPEVSIGSSNVAVVPKVRKRMVQLQKEMAKSQSVVMDGRDIGTRVLPQAELKIFLTASVEERARRRYEQLSEAERAAVSISEVERDIKYRDFNDSNRECDPLRIADDAIFIDTTGKSIEEVVDSILDHAEKVLGQKVK